jgi:hypothetical protein
LINTISMFARKAIVAASLGIVATVGWTIQGLGTAYFFRQAGPVRVLGLIIKLLTTKPCLQIWAHHNAAGHSVEKVCFRPSGAMLFSSFPTIIGQIRAYHTWRQGILHEGLR